MTSSTVILWEEHAIPHTHFHTAHASQASVFFLLSNSIAAVSAVSAVAASYVVLEHNNR
jgi:hypothetical protein